MNEVTLRIRISVCIFISASWQPDYNWIKGAWPVYRWRLDDGFFV